MLFILTHASPSAKIASQEHERTADGDFCNSSLVNSQQDMAGGESADSSRCFQRPIETMLEELFTHQPTLKQHMAAPLLEARIGFLRHLRESGARPSTLQHKATNMLRLIYLLDLKHPRKISDSEIAAAATEWSRPGMFRAHRTASSRAKAQFIGDVLHWLRFLGWREVPDKLPLHPHIAEVSAFAMWASEERGYAQSTVRAYCGGANMFLRFLAASNTPLASVSMHDIDRYFLERALHGPISRATMNNYAQRLQAFFRFAEDRGLCTPGIAAAIVVPRLYANESVPTRLRREDVVRLLATTEGNRRADIRDRAILKLLIAYGLRSGEVLRLELDDLDWDNDTLTVRRSKSGRTNLFPLSPSVGQAILRYILEVRPTHYGRTLFLTLKAPIGPIAASTLWSMVRNRLRRLGIVIRQAGASHPSARRRPTSS